jgi:Arm DNA-binding domain
MAKHQTAIFKTDRQLKAFKPSPDGTAYDVRDDEVSGLRVRVMPNKKTFVLMARFPGNKQPVRQAIGTYGEMTLEEARDKARYWRRKLKANIDPRAEEERARAAEERKRENSFAAVAERFIAYIHRHKLRTAPVMERNLRETFIKNEKWGPRPITEILATDVKRVIERAVERGSTYQAFHDLALVRRLFNWAIGTDDYGLELNPCRRLNSKDLIGEAHARDRVLNDDELRALWRVTDTWVIHTVPYIGCWY